MLNTEKLKKRYYIFVVFHVFLFAPIIIFLLDEVVNPDFTQKYKTIISVFKYFCSILPIVLAWILTNYIAKKTKNVEK